MLFTGTALLIGLTAASDNIELHLLGKQAAEALVPRRHWAGVTQAVMLKDPLIPKGFECWSNDVGYNLYLDWLSQRLIRQSSLYGDQLLYIASNGRHGTKPDQTRMLWVSWDTVKVPLVIQEAARSYIQDH